MGRQINDGRGRLGGRSKGTPNKPIEKFALWSAGVLDKNRTKVEQILQMPWNDGAVMLYAALIVAAAIDRATSAQTNE